jgi:peptidoglycan hydrolase CwlO-like protein
MDVEAEIREERKKITKKYLVYDIIIFSGIAVIVIWMILKMAGVINTPEYQKMIPFAAGIVTFVGAILKFGQNLGDMQSTVNWLKKSFARMDRRQNNMAAALSRVESDVEHLNKDVDRFDRKFDRVENKMDRLAKCKNYKATA